MLKYIAQPDKLLYSLGPNHKAELRNIGYSDWKQIHTITYGEFSVNKSLLRCEIPWSYKVILTNVFI